MGNQNQLFDGFQVSLWDGKFAGGFDLEDEFAEDIVFDDVVTFVVTARVGGVSFGETKNGDIKRTNNFQVTSATVLDKDMAEKVVNTLGLSVNGVNAGQQKLPKTTPIQTGPIVDSSDDDGPTGEPVTVDDAQPVSDPVLQKFLRDEL